MRSKEKISEIHFKNFFAIDILVELDEAEALGSFGFELNKTVIVF